MKPDDTREGWQIWPESLTLLLDVACKDTQCPAIVYAALKVQTEAPLSLKK